MPPKPKKQTLAQALKKIRDVEPCKSKPKGKLCKSKLAKAVKDHKAGVKRIQTKKKDDPTTQLRQNINIKIGEDKKPVKKRKTRPKQGVRADRDNRVTQGQIAPAPTTNIFNIDTGLPDAPPPLGQYGDRPIPPIPVRRGYEDPVGYADEVARRQQERQEQQRARRPAGRLDARNVADEFNIAEAERRRVIEAEDRERQIARFKARPNPRKKTGVIRLDQERQGLRGVEGGGAEDESKGSQADFDVQELRRQQRARGAERHRAGLSLGGGLMTITGQDIGNVQQQFGIGTGAGAAYPGGDARFPVLGQEVPPQDPIGNPSGGASTYFRTGQARNGVRTGGDPPGSGGGAGLLSDGIASSTSLGHQHSGHARLAHAEHASQPQVEPQPRRRGRPRGARTRPAEVRLQEQQERQDRREARVVRGQGRLSRLASAVRRRMGGGSQSAIVPYQEDPRAVYQDASLGGEEQQQRAREDPALGGGAERRIISQPEGRIML